jgi:hypothetical protein
MKSLTCLTFTDARMRKQQIPTHLKFELQFKLMLSCLIIGWCLFSGNLNAQSLSPSVISNGGGSSTQLSYTIGESLTFTLSNASAKLTQGFHQTFLEVVSVEEPDAQFAVNVFPNPTRNQLQFSFPKQFERIEVSIFDAQGKLIHVQAVQHSQRIEIGEFARGIYTVIITHPQLDAPKQFSILRS